MTTLNIIQVVLEVFGALMLLFPICDIWIRKNGTTDKSRNLQKVSLFVFFLLLADSIVYLCRGNADTIGVILARASNFLVFSLEYIMQIYFLKYLIAMIEENGGNVNSNYLKIIRILVFLGIFGLVVTQFTGFYYTFSENNEYRRASGIGISFGLHFFMLIIEMIPLIRHRKEIGIWNTIISGSYFLVLFGAGVIQFIWYGISFTNIGITYSLMAMFVGDSFDRSNTIIRQMKQLVEQQRKSEEMRRRILLSTIQPHFLFNTLNAIEGLVTIDPDKALTALGDVSRFLRASTDVLNSDSLVTIEREVQILKYYLSLMELRFWGALVIEIDEPLPGVDYLIPPFTLQPLAENAVNHGIRKRKRGCGKLTIRFREEEKFHLIQIMDDGVGFRDKEEKKEELEGEKHVHMGITMVRERLSLMCDGSLEIHSEPGVGTTCEIRIPK